MDLIFIWIKENTSTDISLLINEIEEKELSFEDKKKVVKKEKPKSKAKAKK